jgi:hypothetical protein
MLGAGKRDTISDDRTDVNPLKALLEPMGASQFLSGSIGQRHCSGGTSGNSPQGVETEK